MSKLISLLFKKQLEKQKDSMEEMVMSEIEEMFWDYEMFYDILAEETENS